MCVISLLIAFDILDVVSACVNLSALLGFELVVLSNKAAGVGEQQYHI